MDQSLLLQRLLTGYNIKLTGGKYYLVSEKNTGKHLEELTKKELEDIPLDIVDESKRTTLFCIDISFFGREVH